MITNAKDIPLSLGASALPDVRDAVMALFQPIRVGIVVVERVNGFPSARISVSVNTLGVKQPMPEQLVVKKEGERSWRWFTIHCSPDLILRTDDIFVLNRVQYRVMSREDWAEYGYLKYEVIEDYRNYTAMDIQP